MDTLEHATSNSGVLASYVSRLEQLYADRDLINSDVKEVFQEARKAGFAVPILRIIVSERRMEAEARENRYILLESYRHQLGMLADMPLGQAAIERANMIQPRKPGRPRKERPPMDPRVEVAPAGHQPPPDDAPLSNPTYYRPEPGAAA